ASYQQCLLPLLCLFDYGNCDVFCSVSFIVLRFEVCVMASSFDVPGYFYPNACLGEFLLVEKANCPADC
ncbi:TPA: hypothetical protein ACQFC6_003453, partial [Escherichia coli]